jgi:Disulfide bond formation protein DsbB
MTTAPPPPPPAPDINALWLPLALFVSVVGVVGSLYLSLGMELKACPLCFYQRAFIMAAAAILGFGMFMRDIPRGALTPLALASAAAGGSVAVWHTYLVANGTLECPIGATRFLLAPHESLVVFALLVAILLVDLFQHRRYVMLGLGALLIGYVFASTSIRATPAKMTEPAPAPLDGCRKLVGEGGGKK